MLKSSLYVVSFENFNICLNSTYFDQRDLKLSSGFVLKMLINFGIVLKQVLKMETSMANSCVTVLQKHYNLYSFGKLFKTSKTRTNHMNDDQSTRSDFSICSTD